MIMTAKNWVAGPGYLQQDLSSVVDSRDLGSFELHGVNVEEFEYHPDIVCVTWVVATLTFEGT